MGFAQRLPHSAEVAIIAALRDILGVSNVEVEDEGEVALAIEWFERGMDFADGLHVASAGHEWKFATFDNSFAPEASAFRSD